MVLVLASIFCYAEAKFFSVRLMNSLVYSLLTGSFYALKILQLKFCCHSKETHFLEFMSAVSLQLTVFCPLESLIISGKLPLMNVYLLLAGFTDALANMFVGYAMIKGITGIACGIGASYSVWYAIIDYLTVLKGIDFLAICFLTAGTIVSSLSDI